MNIWEMMAASVAILLITGPCLILLLSRVKWFRGMSDVRFGAAIVGIAILWASVIYCLVYWGVAWWPK